MEASLVYLAGALLIGLGGLSAAVGVGILGGKLMEGCARQPELGPRSAADDSGMILSTK